MWIEVAGDAQRPAGAWRFITGIVNLQAVSKPLADAWAVYNHETHSVRLIRPGGVEAFADEVEGAAH